MRRTPSITALMVMLAGAACADGEVDFYVHEIAVVVETDAAFARAPDLPGRLESTVDAALAYWAETGPPCAAAPSR